MPFGTRPGPHRHDHVLRRDKAALVVIDLQERLLVEVARRDQVVSNAAKLVEAATVLGVPIVVTEHHAKIFGKTAIPVPAPIHKMIFSCFSVDEFREKIGALGRRQLILAGLETHICVCQTALDAVAEGYSVHAVRDACSARTEENHAIGVEKMAGGGVIPCSTEIAIFELLERAGTDEFRRLLPLIKSPGPAPR
jgi:nicotinamidase-related amidase